MPEPTPADRRRWANWTLRLKIIALGLTIGIVARWVNQAWQATAAPKQDSESISAPK
jgi:hypothetical protein